MEGVAAASIGEGMGENAASVHCATINPSAPPNTGKTTLSVTS